MIFERMVRPDFVRLMQIVLGRRFGSQVVHSSKGQGRFVPPIAQHPLPPNQMFGCRILVVAVIFAGSAVFAGEHFDLSVRGVKLGTLKPTALTVLGKPLRTETGHDSEMGMGDTLDLAYPGLTIELCKPEGHPSSIPTATEFHVWRIRITDARWNVSPGLHVGMSRTALERILGKPRSAETKNGITTLNFAPFTFDAFVWVQLRNAVVTEIGMAEDWA